jgi:tRNA threonylcarbamoyladenosine biosynthesis protein TsaB
MSALLAIETSQHIGSVAVRDRAGEIQSEQLSPKKRHDDDLLPAIDRLFARCGFKPRDLAGGAVAVSIGPGGFTGLRIAVATAKMFAETLGAKVIAVPSALVAAQGQKSEDKNKRVLVALAAKGSTFWATQVERVGDHWQLSTAMAPGIVDARTMPLADIQLMIADEHLPGDVRDRCARENVLVLAPEFHAAACLVLAEHMLARGEFTDPLALLPLYPRQPEAVTIWEQRGPQAGKAQ